MKHGTPSNDVLWRRVIVPRARSPANWGHRHGIPTLRPMRHPPRASVAVYWPMTANSDACWIGNRHQANTTGSDCQPRSVKLGCRCISAPGARARRGIFANRSSTAMRPSSRASADPRQ
jgi:hypothetical protein